jgi:glutamyl-tRNA(Gln) amidotransferase subunit E
MVKESKIAGAAQTPAAEGKKTADYYKSIGFMCGLEIHQRLATKTKLFCSCPANIEQEAKPMAIIERQQRAVAGELGNIDRSAEFEESKGRTFSYMVGRRSTCLVEIDEEPPHLINPEALELALSFAKAMDMRIVDELQPMRKEVVDGSDPSAFQRTVLIGVDGMIRPGGLEIQMPSIFLEEESCGIVSSAGKAMTYDTSRLGIPLIEIDTFPYIPSPEAAKEIALYIGMMLRISGKVQRGIGSIRQDVNVSIKGGARVEIKGMQDVDLIDRFVENEITRQQKLLEIKTKLVLGHAVVGEPKEITQLFKGTSVKVIIGATKGKGMVYGFGLKGFAGVIGTEVNPQRRLGTEMSDYAKMAGVNGIIHSDEDLAAYGFSEKEISDIRKTLAISEEDAFAIVAGNRDNAEKAARLAADRAKYALVGVPLETRGVANTDLCTTKFLRPLPGGSRMYPETDVRPIPITDDMTERADKSAPDVGRERSELAKSIGSSGLVEQLIVSPRLPLYKAVAAATNADRNFVANILMQKFTELKRNGFGVDSLSESRVIEIFSLYEKGAITKQAVEELLKALSVKNEDPEKIIESKKLGRIGGDALRELVADAKSTAKDPNNKDELRGAIMSKYRFNVDGAELNSIL